MIYLGKIGLYTIYNIVIINLLYRIISVVRGWNQYRVRQGLERRLEQYSDT